MELSQCDTISVVKQNLYTILHSEMQEHDPFLGLLNKFSQMPQRKGFKHKESIDQQSNRSLAFSIYRVEKYLKLQAVSFEHIPLFILGATSLIC